MAFDRPTLTQLIDRGAAEFESRIPGVLVRLRVGVLSVLNRVIAGGLSALYKYAERLNDQVWPDKCDALELPRHGARWGIAQIGAGASVGVGQFSGADGAVIPLGTLVQRGDAVQYTTTAVGTIAAGVASVPLMAVVAELNGDAPVGTSLTLTSSVPGINAAATVSTAMAGGADVESIEAWRARILARIRKPPQGGADYDYEAWTLEVPGVTRVWVNPGEQGPGTVVVRFVRDDDASPIPDATEVAAVQAHLDALRPTTAACYVVAPIAVLQNYTIGLTPNSAAVKAAVEAELKSLYRNEAAPGCTMLLSHEREAVSAAAGETDNVITVPAANQVYATGQLPMLGAITWL
jgi:uncharacterized phage protein gp47/JayE